MKVIVNFGEKKVVVPCGTNGDLSIRELIQIATAKYCKLSSFNNVSNINSNQIQLRLNNSAVLDPDDRVCDVVDDREEIFTIINSQPINSNSNGELSSSSLTSSNLSTSLSDHERPGVPPPPPKLSLNQSQHEVIVTDADLRTRSLRIKTESNNTHPQNLPRQKQCSTPKGMYNLQIDDKTGDQIFSIILPKENNPLGIHVIPNNSNENQVNGLIIQNIESDGRIKRQGILEINDRIIEINRINIEQCSFEKAQLIFRNALLESELELKIYRSFKKATVPFYLNNSNEFNQNTKRLGKIYKITLIKGNDGLGFKLASRDNPTGIANPIYVKTIFPKGAAIEDGRLCTGDRLLTVNSIDVTQMSLQDAVGLLRETRIGDTVHLCVSRQQDGSLPKDLLNEEVKTQIMTFDIPLRDTSSAGLGITLKGKTSIIDGKSIDLGIYVKSVLTGGAAYRDDRLRPNDQILIINNSSLVNMSNLEAASILHDAVRKEIQPGYIKITISRDEQDTNSKNIKEIELLPLSLSSTNNNNDENELDLTNFVPSINHKPPLSKSSNSESWEKSQTISNEKQNPEEIVPENSNPFERETPFRQSISEKRRLASPWKQQPFQQTRTNSERRQPTRVLVDSSSSNLIRSSSYESIHPIKEDEGQKPQLKPRNKAWNDSFRQAVDKSYCQNNHNDNEKSSKNDKPRFKFTNLFTTKSKRKENQNERSLSPSKTSIFSLPPPPPPFTSQQDIKSQNNNNYLNSRQQCYQPYRFDANQNSHNSSTNYQSQVISGKSSLSIHPYKPTHPPLPRQFIQSGTQSLKQHQINSRSHYPSIIPTKQNFDFPIHQQTKYENPANV